MLSSFRRSSVKCYPLRGGGRFVRGRACDVALAHRSDREVLQGFRAPGRLFDPRSAGRLRQAMARAGPPGASRSVARKPLASSTRARTAMGLTGAALADDEDLAPSGTAPGHEHPSVPEYARANIREPRAHWPRPRRCGGSRTAGAGVRSRRRRPGASRSVAREPPASGGMRTAMGLPAR